MTDNEILLKDRIEKIKSVIKKYGEGNFYISYSGGKDSTVLSALIDIALPNNEIPRVYANTGIELNMIRDFVIELQKTDKRIVIIKPTLPIRQILEKEGYPFKSKEHSLYVSEYQRMGENSAYYQRYLYPQEKRKRYGCPKILRYQFTPEFKLKISKKCCDELKKKPLKKWMKENDKRYCITGMIREEGGARNQISCFSFKQKKFNPLAPVTKEWEDWLIEKYSIKICDIYKEPYNFTRTGCKGCPFAIDLQHNLNVMEEYFPNERKQCEIIWKPVYDEYRRLGYRLKDKVESEEHGYENNK